MNLLKETEYILAKSGYTLTDVASVQGENIRISVEHFVELAMKTDYKEGYGAPKIATDLVLIMKDGTWFDREEYDGAEWWRTCRCPKILEDIQDDKVHRLVVTEDEVGWCCLGELVKNDSAASDEGDTSSTASWD